MVSGSNLYAGFTFTTEISRTRFSAVCQGRQTQGQSAFPNTFGTPEKGRRGQRNLPEQVNQDFIPDEVLEPDQTGRLWGREIRFGSFRFFRVSSH